jgi:multidrug efflux pump subunit AcrB
MRPYPIILSLTALALIGYLLLPQLTIRWQPGSGEANLRVSYAWPGAGPEALEQQVTAPLEGAFALVRDIDEITSISRAGRGSISLKLRRGADGDFVRFNVASQIRRLYPELPAEVRYPTLDYAAGDNDDLTDLPVMTYTLSGPDPPTELYRYATEQLVPRLSLLRGLNRMEVTGGNRPHWRIDLRPDAVAAAGLSPEAIRNHLRNYFQRSGLGFLRSEEEKLYAYVDATTAPDDLSPRTWAAIPLPSTTDRQLTLGDLATVTHVPLPPRSFYRINGENSIRLLAYATEDANRLALAAELRTRVRALSSGIERQEVRNKREELRDKKQEARGERQETRASNLPFGYALHLEDDATRFLRDELVKTRRRTALSMGILLLFVLIA